MATATGLADTSSSSTAGTAADLADAESDGEPPPDLAQAQSEARTEAETEAETERAEDETAASEPSPTPAGGPAEAADRGGSGAEVEEQSNPEAVPEASVDAAAHAEEPEATEADVSSAANAEVEAAASEGPDDDAVGATGAGGGSGGSAAIEDEQPAAPPDVSGAPPEQGLSQAAALPPAQLLSTLGGVQAAAQHEAGQARSELAANPPQRPRPSGAPATVPGPASDRAGAPAGGGPSNAPTVPAGPDRPVPQPPAPPVPTNAPPAPPAPRIPDSPEGESMGESGAQAMRQAINQLPARDPGLRIPAPPAPRVELEGNADPGSVDVQAAETESSVNEAAAEGASDAAHPMGEDELYPTVPPETLRAEVPSGAAGAGDGGGHAGGSGGAPGGGPPAAAGGGGSTEDEAASIVAHKEHGDEVRAAVQQGSGQMATARADRAQKEQQERQRGEQEMARLEQENARQQAAERQQARGEVSQRRAQWRAQQAEVVGTARRDAHQARRQARQEIERERTQGEEEAGRHQEQGRQEAEEARRRGEEEADRERQRARQESSGGGFFGWVASAARSFFDGIRRGIQAAFALARQAVQAALQRAQQLAHAVIERARQAAVALVRVAGTVLTGIANVALAAFPTLRQAAVGFIQNRVRAAEAAINNLANRLKEGVTAALNLLGRALNGILNLMERAYLAAVNFVASAVQGIINRVKQAMQMLGQFAALVRDIASNPLQWLRNLGAALMDGVRNHLWPAFKNAVKQWFNEKVEQVVGVGRVVWNLLIRGGISLAQIGRMAWEGIKAAIPPALVALLIEKLISMLVPAAGAIMTIIQGLQAAWGAASRILQAIERFMAFLRAVRGGNAGPAFAQAVAAAATAVLDFLANFLLARLARGASRVGQRLRSIAQRIGQRLRGVMQRVGRRLRGVGRRLRGIRRRIGRRVQRARDRLSGRRRETRQQRRERERRRKQERLDRALAAIRPALDRVLARGTTGLLFRARLLYWRLRYRLTSLTARESGGEVDVWARVNPEGSAGRGKKPTRAELRVIVHEAARDVLNRPDVQAAAQRMREQRASRPSAPVAISGPEGLPGAVRYFQERGGRVPRRGRVQQYELGQDRRLVSEKQQTGATNALVMGIGSYPEIAGQLRATGLSDRRIATIMRSFVRTGRLPRNLPQQDAALLARLTMLMFGRESARSRGNVALAPMTLDLVRGGRMSWDEAFASHEGQRVGGRGAFPMSMEGAAGASRGLSAEAEGRPPGRSGGSAAERAELAAREISIVVRWLNMQLGAKQGLLARGPDAIREYIVKMVLKFYGIR